MDSFNCPLVSVLEILQDHFLRVLHHPHYVEAIAAFHAPLSEGSWGVLCSIFHPPCVSAVQEKLHLLALLGLLRCMTVGLVNDGSYLNFFRGAWYAFTSAIVRAYSTRIMATSKALLSGVFLKTLVMQQVGRPCTHLQGDPLPYFLYALEQLHSAY